jgi:hypothetical protein
MSDNDCPLWPDVRALQGETAALDARVHALELGGRQEPASERQAGDLGWLLAHPLLVDLRRLARWLQGRVS